MNTPRLNVRCSLDDLHAARLMRSLAIPANPRVNLGALILGAYTAFLVAFTVWALASGAEPYQATEPVCGVEGTDWYYECTTGDEIDLTPTTPEDEADTTTSQERN